MPLETAKKGTGRKRKRIINFRPFLLVALALIGTVLGIRISFSIFWLGILIFCLILASLAILLVISIVKRKKMVVIAAFILAIIFCLAAGLNAHFSTASRRYASTDTIYIVSGRVDSINFSDHSIILDNLQFNGEDYGGRLRLFTDFQELDFLFELRLGDYLIFESSVIQRRLIRNDGSINSSVHRTRIYHTVREVRNNEFVVSPSRGSPRQRLTERVYNNLFLAMGHENASIAFALVTGDRNDVAVSTRDAYSASGLMHIMAISGLHIGFLVLMLLLLFKLLKIKKIISHPIIIGFLILYTVFIGFSASVIRAVIIATVFLLASTFSKKFDSLNTLALALCIILLYSPLALFEVGFLFSFGSVLGIIIFYRPISNGLRKIKVPKFLAGNAAISVSAQLGILPSMVFFFNSMQIYSVIVNFFMHFVIQITHFLLMIFLVLSLIIPPLGILLQLVGILIAFISTVASIVALFPHSLLFVYSAFGVLLFSCYLFYFLSSRFVRLPRLYSKKQKEAIASTEIHLSKRAVSLQAAEDINIALLETTNSSTIKRKGNKPSESPEIEGQKDNLASSHKAENQENKLTSSPKAKDTVQKGLKSSKYSRGNIARVIACLLIALFILFIGIPFSRVDMGNNFIAPIGGINDVTTVVKSQGRTYIIGDLRNFRNLDNALRRLGKNNIHAIFAFDMCDLATQTILRLRARYRIGTIFVHENANLYGAVDIVLEGVHNVEVFCGNFSLTSHIQAAVADNRLIGYKLLTDNGNILFAGRNTDYRRFPIASVNEAFAIRLFVYRGYFSDRIFLPNLQQSLFASYLVPENIFHSTEQLLVFNFITGESFLL